MAWGVAMVAMRIFLWVLTVWTFCFSGWVGAEGNFALSDIKPGLEGYALTAGAGNVISRFPIKVLEVVQDAGEDFPYILFRASGDFIAASGGIAAGMSGSPVYVNEKLVGAVSAGFPSADHNLGLITPIEVMTRALPIKPTTLVLEKYGLNVLKLPPIGAVPLAAPLAMSGISSRARDHLLEALRARGINQTVFPSQAQTGGGSTPLERPYKLEPGAPISVRLISGDMNIGAIGTVTALVGNQILAFGHPFLRDARARFAAAPAYVNAIIPSSTVPFKLAENAGVPFGAILTDRPYAVGGVVGQDAGLLPLEITVKNGTVSRVWKLGLAPVESFVGVLSLISLQSALDTMFEGNSPGSVIVRTSLEFTDRPSITLRDRATSENDVGSSAALRAAVPISVLLENPYRASGLKAVKVNLEVASFALARIVKLEPEVKKAKAGQVIGVNVRLQPYRGTPVVRRISFKIPEGQPEGALKLRVRGGLTPRPTDPNDSNDIFEGVLTFEDLLEKLKNRLSSENMFVESGFGHDTDIIGLEKFADPVLGLIPFEIAVVK
jgi:SpoIVB peptidase S55